jgi:4a-hydroxytetrahydrobiopterin dehydratase
MDDDRRLTRGQVSAAVSPLGWRLILGAVCTEVDVPSLTRAAEAAGIAAAGAGPEGQERMTVDVRGDRAVLRLMPPAGGLATGLEVRLAREVSEALAAHGFTTTPGLGDRPCGLQGLEIAIDAIDIPKVRPFWQAVTGYVDEHGPSDLTAGLIDPLGRGPAIWFQQMDEPRGRIGAVGSPACGQERSDPGNVIRNRIHLDVDVPHDMAQSRLQAALAAGGTLLDDRAAPAFWVLADPEGNEACICTWQGRD